MTVESAKAFLEKAKADEAFRKAVGEIATKEERMEFMNKAGFDFTKEELEETRSELSDAMLNEVAGGQSAPASVEIGWNGGYS